MQSTQQNYDSQELSSEIADYVFATVEAMKFSPKEAEAKIEDTEALANQIFGILTHRKFCYLSRKRVEKYRDDVVASLVRRIELREPLRMFYDIGPGYHATTRPGVLPLRFDVGLSELMILAQVNALCGKVAEYYPHGVKFWFVVDNLCALRTNDVPVEHTESYVRQFRELIGSTDMSEKVDLVVESETFNLEEYDKMLEKLPAGEVPQDPSPEAIDNVARFLGRPCTVEEAAERMERYSRTGPVTDSLVDRLVRDVHMTQRATGATLGFRPFSGGDQRTQAGELVLARGSKGRLRPILLTTQNIDAYECSRFELPDVLPAPISYVAFATPISE